jgi:hypothetical protein
MWFGAFFGSLFGALKFGLPNEWLSRKRNREEDTPDLPSLKTDVAAMKADAAAMKADVAAMKADVAATTTELEAMKCAQGGSPCPDGFDLGRFKYFAKQCKSAATQFQKRFDAKENDIRTKENNIRTKENNIRTKENDIRTKENNIRTKENDIRTKENDIRNQQARTAPVPSFADVEEACAALRQSSHLVRTSPTTLSFCASWYNQDAIKRGLLEGINKVLTAWENSHSDKSQVPLLCVLGTMGQGKTDTLMHCRRNEILRKDITDAVMTRTQQQGRLHILTLFATFNQVSTYNALFEPDVESALCNRLLADYLDVGFSATHTQRFKCISLETLIDEIRKLEATKRGCKPDNICIMILVDEMRKLGNETNMRDILDALNAAQQSAISGGKLTFVVATCSDVEGICSFTRVSGRPLHAIPLLPCKSTDIDDFVEKCWASALLKKHMITVDDRELLLWRAHATGGHFRSLETLWNHFLTTGSVPSVGYPNCASAAYALEIVARHLHSPAPKLFLYENYMLGAVFANIPELRTLHDVATNVLHQQVFYKEVDVVRSTVRPCVSPLSLCESFPSDDDTDVAKGIVQVLRQQILSRLTATKREWIKGWEVAIPLLEAVVATMIHEVDLSNLNSNVRSVHSKAPVAMDRVFLRKAVVQHWDPKKPDKLQYSHGCRSFMELWSETNRSDRKVKTRHSDTAALKEACQATTPLLCMAITDNYPAVEGVHTMLEAAPAPGGTRQVIPVVFQMKACATVTATDVKNWADAAHEHARNELGLHKKKYYVMLYLTAHFDESWMVAVPKGTIVIDRAALERVLQPFGATPFLTPLKGRDEK